MTKFINAIRDLFDFGQMDYGIEPTAHLRWEKHRANYGMGLLGPAVYHAINDQGKIVATLEWDPFQGSYNVPNGTRWSSLEDAKKYIDFLYDQN